MDLQVLLEGYRRILASIYSPGGYYRRVRTFLRSCEPVRRRGRRIRFPKLGALARTVVHLGVFEKGRNYYWGLFFWSLIHRPRQFTTAITLAVYGYNFRRVLSSPGQGLSTEQNRYQSRSSGPLHFSNSAIW